MSRLGVGLPCSAAAIPILWRWVFTASRKPGGYGSYGRGTAGVGSDLDLLLILKRCEEPIWERLRRWDTGALPLPCDLLVYSLEEWRSLPRWNPRLAEALLNDTRWLGERLGSPLASTGSFSC